MDFEVEPTSNLIIKGGSTSRFYVDTRPMPVQASTPAVLDDLTAIFEIQTSGEAGEENAAQMQSQIVHNQQSFTYWTNFDHWADWVTVIIYLLGISSITAGSIMLTRGGDHAHPDLDLEPDITFAEAGGIDSNGGDITGSSRVDVEDYDY